MTNPASAGQQTVIASDADLFRDERGCTSFLVGVLSTSSNSGLVRVPGLHNSGDYFLVQKGYEYIFRLNDCGIKRVIAKGNGGAADFYFGVVSRT